METPDSNPGADLLREPAAAGAPGAAAAGTSEAGDRGLPTTTGEVVPAVVAVLVTSDSGPWLEEALASLAAQEYPALSVLVLDNGCVEDPTPRIAAAMPRAFVRRMGENVGFARAANDAMALVEGATFLLFCHDDVSLGPEAVGIMVEEAYRSNAAIVGPKFVDYDHPDVLLEVGLSIDHYGVPFTGIEPGELDQEQHDAVRDVFYTSDAAMLVRVDLFKELDGFDAKTFPGSDDLDLCWRARLAGARVLVAPDARVRHRRATVQDERPTRRNDVGDMKAWTRSRVRTITKAYSGVALFWVLPMALLLNLVEAIALVFARRPARGRAVLAGWFGAFGRGSGLRQARASTQKLRRVDDGDVRDLMVRGSARVRMLVTHRLHAGDRIAEVSNRTRAAVSVAGSRARAFHVVAAIGLIALIAFGSRSLVLDRVPEVGSLRDWPGAGSLWSTFFASWRTAMMGADAPASPAFGLMALLTTGLLGDSDIGRTLVVAGALPLGTFGAYRLARPFARTAAPAVAAAVAYAVNPIARNAIAEGQLGPLVCFGLAPFVLSALVRAASISGAYRRRRGHLVLTVGLLLLVATAAWPPALLLALLMVTAFVLAWPLVGDRIVVGRSVVVAVLGTLVAAFVLLPWFLTTIGADAATRGLLPRGPIELGDVLSFHTGASGAGLGAVGLLVAAALPLFVATGERLAWAGRAWMLALVSFTCAWLPARLDVNASVPAPEGILVPAAVGLSLAVGIGVAAFLEELHTFHFGWRQLAAVAAAVGIALPVLGFVADTFDGRWGMSKNDWPSQFAWMREERDNGDFRVLWLGDPTILPADAKVVDGVGYALTREGPGDARALWAAPESDADRKLGDAVALVHDDDTARFGHLLGPTGVRYIVVTSRAAPDSGARGRPDPALSAAMAAQLDLAVSRVEPGAVVYENQAWVPARAMVPPDREIPAADEDSVGTAQRTTIAGAEPVDGPLSDSNPAGPGTLLWADAANSGWRATVDGERAPRSDAFGWTNSFEITENGPIDLSFSGGPRRLFIAVELLCWIAAAVVWFRTRDRNAA